MTDIFIVQLPSPPRKNVFREWSGGMGTALDSAREGFGHDPGYYDIPYSPYLYIARRLRNDRTAFRYLDLQASQHCDLAAFDALFRDEQPKLLITQVNLPSFDHDLELVARARRIVPGLRVILVGAAGKWFRDLILSAGLADLVMEEVEELLVSGNALPRCRIGPATCRDAASGGMARSSACRHVRRSRISISSTSRPMSCWISRAMNQTITLAAAIAMQRCSRPRAAPINAAIALIHMASAAG